MRSSILKITALALTSTLSMPCVAMFQDDPLLTKVMSEFEYIPEEDDGALEWDIDAWVGRDLYKVWLKTSGE